MASKMKDTRERFSHITLSLHWLIAVFIIGLMALGFYMAETSSYDLYPTHKSMGIFIFFFIVIRVLWRWKNGWPPQPPPAGTKRPPGQFPTETPRKWRPEKPESSMPYPRAAELFAYPEHSTSP